MEQIKFKPFDRIIVKRKGDNKEHKWICAEFSHYDENWISFVGGYEYEIQMYDILPYEGNEHLVGTSDMPDEEFTLEEHSICLFSNNMYELESGFGTMARFRRISRDFPTLKDSFCVYYANNSENNYYYCIPFSKFNKNDMQETKKHILCVKNGKLVKAIETLKTTIMNEETNTYLERMRELTKSEEHDIAHGCADDILCELVEKYVPNGVEIVKKYNEVEKWYS